VAKQEFRLAQTRGDQFFQPERGGRDAARKLRHESHARFLDALFELQGLVWFVDIEGGPTVNALAEVAGSQNRECAIPLGREDQDHVDVVPATNGPKAGYLGGVKVAGRLLGKMRNLAANGPYLKPVGKGPQGGPMSTFPGFTQSNDARTKLHSGGFASLGAGERKVPIRKFPSTIELSYLEWSPCHQFKEGISGFSSSDRGGSPKERREQQEQYWQISQRWLPVVLHFIHWGRDWIASTQVLARLRIVANAGTMDGRPAKFPYTRTLCSPANPVAGMSAAGMFSHSKRSEST
jgi:hypothetical protein